MRLKHLIFASLSAGSIFLWNCTEPELRGNENLEDQKLSLNQGSDFDKEGLDSAAREEGKTRKRYLKPKPQYVTPNANAPINRSRTASVSATSTYPGYSVQNIKDGDKDVTVGPQFSWANNFDRELGIRLPQSVYLNFIFPIMMESIEIYTSEFFELQNYTIYYRLHGSNTWTRLVTVTGNIDTHRIHNFGIIQNVIAVEIRCELGPAVQTIYGRLNEVEVYSPVFNLPPFPDPILLD